MVLLQALKTMHEAHTLSLIHFDKIGVNVQKMLQKIATTPLFAALGSTMSY